MPEADRYAPEQYQPESYQPEQYQAQPEYYYEPPVERYQQPEPSYETYEPAAQGYFAVEPAYVDEADYYANDAHVEEPYADDAYADEYTGPSYRDTLPPELAAEASVDYGYAEPRIEPVRRRNRDEADSEPSDDSEWRAGPNPRAGRVRKQQPAVSSTNPVIPIGVATVALAAAGVISPQAVAAVAVALQAIVALGWLSVTGNPSRRAAVVATLPAIAADIAVFHFQSDAASTAVAAAIGAGFVLTVADAVLRAARHGIETGASRDLAASVAAMLLTCMAALVVIAARLDATYVVTGAVLAGLAAFLASRRSDTPLPWTALVGLSFTAAAIASYGAAILFT